MNNFINDKIQETTKILIVDDNEGDKLLIESLLCQQSEQNFDVTWCRSISEAHDFLKDEDINAALVDYELGDGFGTELLTKHDSSSNTLPFIMMTGYNSVDVDKEALEAGAADFISKDEMTSVLLERTIRYAIEQANILKSLKEKENRLLEKNQELKCAQTLLHAQNSSISQLAKHLADTTFNRLHAPVDGLSITSEELGDLKSSERLGFWQIGCDGTSLYMSDIMHELLALTHIEGQANSFTIEQFIDCFIIEDRDTVKDQLHMWLEGKKTTSFHATLITSPLPGADNKKNVVVSIALVETDDNQPSSLLITMVDTSKRQQVEKNVQDLIYKDHLTNLFNRLAFNLFLPQAISNAKRNKSIVGVLYLDLDDFKKVNDVYGHPAGDKLLKVIARKLHDQTRDSDIIARLSGDEFGIILTNLSSEKDAADVAMNMLDNLKKPMGIEGHSITCTCSIGIALSSEENIDAETLIRHADLALYRAKQTKGVGSFEFFDNDLHQYLTRRRELEFHLKDAVTDFKQFIMYYQPIADIRNIHLTGVEALLRWHHPKHGILTPDAFLEIAERSGIILQLGNWILEETCRHMVLLQDTHTEIKHMAINLSPSQLFQSDLISTIKKVLKNTGCNPKNIIFEITEHAVIENLEKARKRIEAIKKLGIRIALDDFGTGYSSLALLKDLPVDILKIDRSFVQNVHLQARNASIIKNVTRMATELGITVTAEGVESFEELESLRKFGCHDVQGYLIGRPTDKSLLLASKAINNTE